MDQAMKRWDNRLVLYSAIKHYYGYDARSAGMRTISDKRLARMVAQARAEEWEKRFGSMREEVQHGKK